MTITDHASQAATNLRSARNTFDDIGRTPNAEIEHRLATAAVQAQLATATAIDRQTTAIDRQTAAIGRLTAAVKGFADYVVREDQRAAAELAATNATR